MTTIALHCKGHDREIVYFDVLNSSVLVRLGAIPVGKVDATLTEAVPYDLPGFGRVAVVREKQSSGNFSLVRVHHFDRATIYESGALMGQPVRSLVRNLDVFRAPFAQYGRDDAVWVIYTGKGKRKRMRKSITKNDGFAYVADGWDTPDVVDMWTTATREGGVVSRKSKYSSFDPLWERDMLTALSEQGVTLHSLKAVPAIVGRDWQVIDVAAAAQAAADSRVGSVWDH